MYSMWYTKIGQREFGVGMECGLDEELKRLPQKNYVTIWLTGEAVS